MAEKDITQKILLSYGDVFADCENVPAYSVSCMVIEWTHKRTRIALSLHDLLKAEGTVEEELAQVDDVKLEIYHMRNLSKEVRDRFKSDMGFVVDYLNEGHFENRKEQKIVYAEALCDMMEALTGDSRFTEQVEELLKKQEKKGEEVLMCEYIDMLEARGELRGKKIGETMLATLLEKLYSLGRDEDAKLAVRDKAARERLYEEFCMAN
nr:hypothetical protein [uncultured Acetatifactor sp.]